jgi:5-(carboxyamino)imidazole ribonucleotide synthase
VEDNWVKCFYLTRKFDIQTLFYSDELKQDCLQSFQGDLMDFETVTTLEKVDVLTFEIELVNLDALLKLEAERLKGLSFT